MEVMIQSPSSSPTKDPFNFNSGAMNSPYLSAPSSPKRFGEYNYLSAPTSPSRISELYSELDYFSTINEASNNNVDDVDVDDDGGFAFFVGRELDNKSSRSAEELFDGGKIKPLKPQSNELFTSTSQEGNLVSKKQQNNRGRERQRTTTSETTLSSSNSGRRVARSHSPYRKTNNTWELEEQQNSRQQQQQPPRSIKEETTTSISSKSSRRWSLKDFLLFRSASEGRGSSKDPLKKYFVGYKKSAEEVKGSSFRSSDNSSTHGSRKKGPVSAHEFHYAVKKAESQDKKKKTFLPYRQGILGRLSGFGI